MISSEERYSKRYITVNGLKMAYVDEGEGDPIIFLSGNLSSSYEWRNVIPHLVSIGRCIAPDFIGMDDSDKLPDSGSTSCRFVEPREVPIAQEPKDVHDIIEKYGKWLLLPVSQNYNRSDSCGHESHRELEKSWPNQAHVQIKGSHFVMEDSPDEKGDAIAIWLQSLPQ